MEENLIYVVKYHDMNLGGIQKIIYRFMKYFHKKNAKIVWIVDKKPDINEGYIDIVNTKTISICDMTTAKSLIRDSVDKTTTLIGMSFDVSSFLAMNSLNEEFMMYDFRNYFIIPNYKGKGFFLEENFGGKTQKKYLEVMKNFYTTLIKNKNLLFCNIKQMEAFEQHYGFEVENKIRSLLPVDELPEVAPKNVILSRFNKKNILSVCRFDFPHKSYVLGLIANFATLKKMHPQATLTVIGYGAGERQVYNKVASIDSAIRKDITIIPGVQQNQLNEYIDNATVSVGLAGSASSAASRGLITLIARHYCPDCEVYGSYANTNGITIREDPGVSVLPELDRVLSLDMESYVEESLNTRKLYEEIRSDIRKDFLREYAVSREVDMSLEILSAVIKMVKRYTFSNRLFYMSKHVKSPVVTIKRLVKRMKHSI